MGIGVCSWGFAGICPKPHNIDIRGVTSRSNGTDERGGIWRRYQDASAWGYRWCHDGFAEGFLLSVGEFVPRWRRKLVVTNASKRSRWEAEPLVKGSVTRRAMHIVKTLRSSSNLQADEIEAALRKWVISMQPTRKDWLHVLKEFDNKSERPLYFKISEWGLEQSWFEAGIRDYTKLIDRYGKEPNVVEAERILHTMESRGITPDLGTYTVLIATYGRAQMLERVHQLLQKLSLAGLELDVVFYKTVIVAYATAGLLSEAEKVLTSMEAAEVPKGLDAYIALLTAYGRRGHATDAQRTFDRMHLKGFRGDVKAFTALMEAYSNAGDYSNAELVFGSLRAAGLKPDDRALASLISVYANANMLAKAAEVVVELETAGMKIGASTLTSLIGWFGKAGLVEEARECFQELQRKGLGLNERAYANMLAAYARVGEVGLAEAVWVAMAEDGVALDDRACRLVVEGLLDGPFHGRELFLSELRARGWEVPADLRVALAGCGEVAA